MSETGVWGLKDISSDWDTIPLKYILNSERDAIRVGPFGSHLSGNDFTEDGYWVYNQRTVIDKNFRDNNTYISLEKYCAMRGFQVRTGDILITTRGTIGRICRVPEQHEDGIIHPCIIRFRINTEKLFYPFLEMVFNDTRFITSQLLFKSNATTIDVIYAETLKNIQIPVPPINYQRKIIDYLEPISSDIDSLSAEIQSQIDTLEQYKRSVITEAVTKGVNPNAVMTDSGVPWIGLIPSSWNCIRGKYILTYVQKPVREDDGVVTCFRDGEVTLRINRREDGFTMADKEIGYQGIDVGDLVVHGMDGFAGAIGISDSRGKASPVINVLDTKQNKRYIMYYLRSLAYGDVFLAMSTGIRVRSCDLRWNKLSELRYPVPSLPEQQQIVEYIDDTIKKTNAVIADKQQQLAILDDYKKSLIYEYVTGKKEVV